MGGAAAGFFGGVTFENIMAEQQMREHHASGEQIRALVGDLEIGLLGAHVIRLAGDHFALLVHEEALGLGDAEVGQLHVAFEGDHDVFEAHVAVNESQGAPILVALGVRIRQAAANSADDEHGQFDR